MLNKTAKKIWKEMSNQDEKLNEEIMKECISLWIDGEMTFVEWKERAGYSADFIFTNICMNKARQQSITNFADKLIFELGELGSKAEKRTERDTIANCMALVRKEANKK